MRMYDLETCQTMFIRTLTEASDPTREDWAFKVNYCKRHKNFYPKAKSQIRYFFEQQSIVKAANHNNCRLLCHLFLILKVIFANSVDPDQTAPLRAV